MKCRYFCRLPLDISPVYLTRGISWTEDGYFFCVLFPIYPSPKQDKPKLNTAIRLSIVNIGIPPYYEIPYAMVSM